jgi:hypothetical protein
MNNSLCFLLHYIALLYCLSFDMYRLLLGLDFYCSCDVLCIMLQPAYTVQYLYLICE